MIKLSILIPSIPSRLAKLAHQFDVLEQQVGNLPVEILAWTDNKKRSIGQKRDDLVQCANGEYLTFLDDDDEAYSCYVDRMLAWIKGGNGADVISIQQHATMNGGNKFLVDFSTKYENVEATEIDGVWRDVTRKPFHTCAWKSSIAKKHRFQDCSYGEDWDWCERVLLDVEREHKTNLPILCYHWSKEGTEAELTFPKGYNQ